MYVQGYEDACIWLRKIESIALDDEALEDFQYQFEKLVVLDYIIRNTDRGNDNWLVKQVANQGKTQIKVAAIDNGLAFPFKHPDEWRTCEFDRTNLLQYLIHFFRFQQILTTGRGYHTLKNLFLIEYEVWCCTNCPT